MSMNVDSLDELGAAFDAWRRRKRHARETVPDELIALAQRAVKKYGVKAVVGVTRLERARLFRNRPGRGTVQGAPRSQPKAAPTSAPGFSRLELGASSGGGPVAEVETVAGVTLRVFEATPEMVGLLSAICGFGEVR